MGMSIDDADTILSCERLNSGMRCGASDEEIDEALGVAIDTMRKYQKIQEIVRWNNAPSPYYKPDGQLFREIIEVLEDDD